jgi:hypothetical protein
VRATGKEAAQTNTQDSRRAAHATKHSTLHDEMLLEHQNPIRSVGLWSSQLRCVKQNHINIIRTCQKCSQGGQPLGHSNSSSVETHILLNQVTRSHTYHHLAHARHAWLHFLLLGKLVSSRRAVLLQMTHMNLKKKSCLHTCMHAREHT